MNKKQETEIKQMILRWMKRGAPGKKLVVPTCNKGDLVFDTKEAVDAIYSIGKLETNNE